MEKEEIKEPEIRDPFLQRAVEYWLDSANELGYQPLFCELLTTRGHVLKYSIRNTTLEQGKDVVSVDSEGMPHAYQLKGGNINLNRWRAEVRPEIEAMIDCPIEHPDIDKAKGHISYLVTNGEIDDAVRVEIVALNEKKWKEAPLHVWTRGDLLNGFQQMAEGILPKDAETYKRLIDLIFADGRALPDIEKVNAFLSEILNISTPTLPKEQRRRDIAAGFLYATMIAGPYRGQGNHVSVVRIMVFLLSLIFHIVDKYGLDDKYWIASYRIIWSDILSTSKLLEAEVNKDGFDSLLASPFEKDLIPFRKHAAISIIYPLKLSQYITGDDEWKSMLPIDIARKYKGAVAVWGEASLLPFIFLNLTLRHQPGAEEPAMNLSKSAVLQILEHNGRKSKHAVGLVPPHFDLDFAVKLSFGMLEEPFEDRYHLSSHMLKSLVDILARGGEREFIAEHWREISFMRLEEFVPDDMNDFYLWRIEKGEDRTVIPQKEQSWVQLLDMVRATKGQNLPPTIRRFSEFLPFFLTVFPHRASPASIGLLDSAADKTESGEVEGKG